MATRFEAEAVSSVWIALGGYAAERNHGYITGLLLLGWLSNIPPALLHLGPRVTQYCTTGWP